MTGIDFLRSKRGKIIVASALCFYVIILFTFYLFRDSLIFQRTTINKSFTFAFDVPFREYFITTPDNITINALYFSAPSPSKGLIFYLHGNADDLRRWGKFAKDFTSLGYDVFMMDYRGYGKSTGYPKEETLHQDASFVFNWVATNIRPARTIIYGRSLGSGVASQLAIKAQPDMLILETPFADFADVIPFPLQPALWLFPFDIQFSNLKTLPLVACRKIIFHGTSDWVVPLSSAEKLKPLLGEDDRFYIIPEAGHRNINKYQLYHEKLAEVLNY